MSASDEAAIRQSIVDACRHMNALGINQGTSGNISVRWRDGLLITPSGLPHERMTRADIVPMRLDGSYEHSLQPSSEWRFHCDILQARADIGAIVHAHPIYATAFAICRKEIPAVHYMIAAAGGPTIRCGAYASYGSAELSHIALAALEGRSACLLANHGMIVHAASARQALSDAQLLETLARQFLLARAAGPPRLLTPREMREAHERFQSYNAGRG